MHVCMQEDLNPRLRKQKSEAGEAVWLPRAEEAVMDSSGAHWLEGRLSLMSELPAR